MGIRKKLPEMRKRMNMFLQSEEGKITKEQALTAAAAMMLVAGTAAGVKGGRSARGYEAGAKVLNRRAGLHGSHGSHGSHCSHGSHSSHGSHGSHASHGSHGSHGSHASHGSHSSHGSHGSW